MNIISVRNLRKSYNHGRTIALRGLDFDVREGEIYGIIGPDGSGKTTLFRILVTLLLADEGQTVDGMAAPGQGDRTVVLDAFFFQPLLVHRGGVCIRHSVFSFCSVLHHHAPSNRRLSLCGRVIPLNFL